MEINLVVADVTSRELRMHFQDFRFGEKAKLRASCSTVLDEGRGVSSRSLRPAAPSKFSKAG